MLKANSINCSSLVSELACSLVILHDFVVEDREVEGKTKFNWIAWRKSNLVGFVVSLKRVLLHLFKKAALGVFSDVAVVVANHLDEESLGLTVTLLGENFITDHVNDFLAITSEFSFNTLFVSSNSLGVLSVLGVLLNRCDCAASGAL